jgi:hypothetical protein
MLRANNINTRDRVVSVVQNTISLPVESQRIITDAQTYVRFFSPIKMQEREFQSEIFKAWDSFNLELLKLQNENNKIQMSMLMNAPKSIKFEPVQQTEYAIEGSFTILRNDIFDFFNRLQVSKLIPFARCKSFVKAYNNHRFPSEWSTLSPDDEAVKWVQMIEKEETLLLYVCINDAPTIAGNTFSSREFVTVYITQAESSLQNTTFKVRIENSDIINEATILQNLFYGLQIFNNKIPISIKLKRRFSQGITVLPNLKLSEPLMFEFLLNNPLFRDTVRVKETNVIYRERGGIPLKLMLDKNTQMDARLFYKFLETKFEPEIKRFPHIAAKDSYIWVLKLNGKLSAQQADILVQKFAACLNIMNTPVIRQQQFNNFYCHFFNNFTAWVKEQPDVGTDLYSTKTELATEIFIPGYERTCTAIKDGKPEVIKVFDESLDDQGKMKGLRDLEEETRKLNSPPGAPGVFVFPPVLPQTHPEYERYKHMKKYIMKVRDAKYAISVTRSSQQNMRNFEDYPLVPCSMNKPTILSKIYMQHSVGDNAKTLLEIIDLESKTEKEQRKIVPVMVKNKILRPGKFGQLPKKLTNALNLSSLLTCNPAAIPINVDEKQYLRLGVAPQDYPVTFHVLNALVQATKLSRPPSIEALKELVSSGITASCGMSVAQGLMILTEKKYMDPRAWYPVLRRAFQTEIIMFYQDKNTNVKGSFETEYFERFRLIDKSIPLYKRTVILYVHKGGEFDNVVHPICELVVTTNAEELKKPNPEFEAVFGTNTPDITFINKMIETMFPTRTIDLNSQLLRSPTVSSQHIDSYGKTRSIVVSQNVPVFTDPIVNQKITPSSSDANATTRIETLLSILQVKQLFGSDHQGLTVVVEDVLEERRYVLGLHKTQNIAQSSKIVPYGFFIPCQRVPYTNDLEQNLRLPQYDLSRYIYPRPLAKTNDSSFASKYKQYLKTANYLKYYMFWLFSKRYEDPTFDNVDEWFNDNVLCVVGTTYDVSLFQRVLSTTEPQVVEAGTQLVIHASQISECQNLKTRLKYILMHTLTYEFNFLRDFKYARFVPNYYNNAAEFAPSSQWTVYDSVDNFKLMTMGTRTKYDVFARLFLSKQESYFVAVKIDGVNSNAQILLAVPCESREKSVSVAYTYNYSATSSRTITPEEIPDDIQLYVQEFNSNLVQTNEVSVAYELRVQIGVIEAAGEQQQQWFAFVDYMKFL